MLNRVSEKRLSFKELFANWKEAILSCNCSAEHIDPITKWLVLTRACVFSMTLTSGLIGGLLAARAGDFNWLYFVLAVVGLLAAHASNNLLNDYFDLEVGLDSSADYARAQYAPHPILSGMATRGEVLAAILILNVIDAAIMIYLALMRGPWVLLFALAGLFISVFYTAPPIRLKRIGLGEIGVTLVWGPLMIGGTYFVTAGSLPAWAMAATIPYALLVAAVLMGKHVDKIPQDREKGIRTLPVIIGDKAALRINQALSILFYIVVAGLVVSGYMGVWVLLVVLSIPMLIETLKLFNQPRPDKPPENYPIWPLWYVAVAFRLTRAAGGAFILGLILNAVFPIFLRF